MVVVAKDDTETESGNVSVGPSSKLWRLFIREVHSDNWQTGTTTVNNTINRNDIYPIDQKRVGFVNRSGEDILKNHNIYEADGVTTWTSANNVEAGYYKRGPTTRAMDVNMDMYGMYVHNGSTLPNPFTTNTTAAAYGARSFSFMNDFGDDPRNTTGGLTSGLGSYQYWNNMTTDGGSIVMHFKDGITGDQFHQFGMQGIMKPDNVPIDYYWFAVGEKYELQYYNGEASSTSYDHSKWTTYATLTHFDDEPTTPTGADDIHVAGNAFPMWRNITEGAFIESEKTETYIPTVPSHLGIGMKNPDPWNNITHGTKYRISMSAIDDASNGDFRGTELAFVGQYLEPTEQYLPHASYSINPSSMVTTRDGHTTQQHVALYPNSEGYRVMEIEYSEVTQLKQIYVGSTDWNPSNNSRTYDKEIKIEVWDGSAYVPHSTIVWEDLPDVNGVTRATSGDNYFPWQPSYNKTSEIQVYPLIGSRGKQILRYDPVQGIWYHYVAYGYAQSRNATGTTSWPKSFDYDGTGAKTVY